MPLKFEIKKKLISRSERVKCVDLHPDLPWVLVSLYFGNLTIYDYNSQTTVKTIENSMAPVRTAKFIVRKQWIVAGSDDLQIRVYNYNTMEKVKGFDAHNDFIRQIHVHPEQPYIISCSDDATVRIWNFEKNFQLVKTLEEHIHYVMDIAINPRDMGTFCTASLDRSIKVWSFSSSGTNSNFTLTGHQNGVNTVDYYKGDKPYIISGADDFLIKIWDYQTKQCVYTLEGHSQNISCVRFHPELPIILSAAEDGVIKMWHSQTYKLEHQLNYNLERAWYIDIQQENSSIISLAYDEGTVVIKVGSDEPIASMNNGKVLWAKNLEVKTANLKAINYATQNDVKDGDNLSVQIKDVRNVDFQPIGIKHAPNGHSFAVYSDSEYMLYRTQTLKNIGFGPGTDLVFAPKGEYAIKEAYSLKIMTANNTQHCELKTDYQIEGLFGGPVLAAKSSDFVIFYDWETARVVRRIDVPAKKVYWNDAGDYVTITTSEDIYILKFSAQALKQVTEAEEEDPEGVEESFDLSHEIHDTATSATWVDNILYYTTPSGKINYCVSGKTFNFAHTDKKKFLLGYVQNQNKVYLTDKSCNVVSYELFNTVPQYLSAVQDGNMEKSRQILQQVPEKYYDKLAKFLDTIDLKKEAFSIVRDQEHKFELALTLQDIQAAFEIAQITQNSNQYKQVGDVALFNGKIQLAIECFKSSNDFGSQLMIYSCLGMKDQMKQLAQQSEEFTRYNVAFAAYFQVGDLESCLNILIKSKRFSEAAVFAKSYLPSKISETVDLWKSDLQKNYPLTAQKIADPMEYIEDSYSDLKVLLDLEEFYKNKLNQDVPAHNYSELKELLNQDIFSQIKDNPSELNNIEFNLPNSQQNVVVQQQQQIQSQQEEQYQQQQQEEDEQEQEQEEQTEQQEQE